jgi:hypothetical protein
MMKCWPTIPAAIIVILAGAAIAGLFGNSSRATAEHLNPTGLHCESQPEDLPEGPEQARLGCHTIQSVARSYDPKRDHTTVAYKVTSCSPYISHWVLGFPHSLAGKVVQASESVEWVFDPATGASGLKFDRRYGERARDDGPRASEAIQLVGLGNLRIAESRTVLVTLVGRFNWSVTDVAVKAGGEVYTGTITAPIELYTEEEKQCRMPE